jgi:hypothetical protein
MTEFGTYRGASTIMSKVFDCKPSRISMLEVEAYPRAVFRRSRLVPVFLSIREICCLWRVSTCVLETNAFITPKWVSLALLNALVHQKVKLDYVPRLDQNRV